MSKLTIRAPVTDTTLMQFRFRKIKFNVLHKVMQSSNNGLICLFSKQSSFKIRLVSLKFSFNPPSLLPRQSLYCIEKYSF